MDGNELFHYGVLGMKWGVRRTPAQLARARGDRTSTSSAKTNKSYSKTSSSSKKASEMTEDELKSKIQRL